MKADPSGLLYRPCDRPDFGENAGVGRGNEPSVVNGQMMQVVRPVDFSRLRQVRFGRAESLKWFGVSYQHLGLTGTGAVETGRPNREPPRSGFNPAIDGLAAGRVDTATTQTGAVAHGTRRLANRPGASAGLAIPRVIVR